MARWKRTAGAGHEIINYFPAGGGDQGKKKNNHRSFQLFFFDLIFFFCQEFVSFYWPKRGDGFGRFSALWFVGRIFYFAGSAVGAIRGREKKKKKKTSKTTRKIGGAELKGKKAHQLRTKKKKEKGGGRDRSLRVQRPFTFSTGPPGNEFRGGGGDPLLPPLGKTVCGAMGAPRAPNGPKTPSGRTERFEGAGGPGAMFFFFFFFKTGSSSENYAGKLFAHLLSI